MRADRLLTILLTLQERGKQTAAELAESLEVSPRTIYRDIEALANAGVPVYADLGPGGGYALLDSYRTTLTGLNADELRALSALSLPGPLADLGLARPLRGAMLKLSQSLPEAQRGQAGAMRQRLHLDAAAWFQPPVELPQLAALQKAAWEDRLVRFTYRRGQRARRREAAPYALVAKAGVWYLVAQPHEAGGLRVYRVERLAEVEVLEGLFERPAAFDLEAYWRGWVAEYEASLPSYPVRLAVAPEMVHELPRVLGAGLREALERAEADERGWLLVEHTFERLEEARAYVLGLGAGVRVVGPEELRESVAAYAREVAGLYAEC